MRETVAEMMSGADIRSATKPKRIANNTVRYERADGATCWRLHRTDVVVKHADGSFTLDSGGWLTPTTKERINRYAPIDVWSDRGVWYVHSGNGQAAVPFFDGMRLEASGKPLDLPAENMVNDIRALKRRITQFCKLVDTVERLPLPEAGDCWFCSMHEVESGRPTGDVNEDVSHLLSHMEEGYLHGSLLVDAMRERGYRDEQIGLHYRLNSRRAFKRALHNYLTRRLQAGATKGYQRLDEDYRRRLLTCLR